MGSEQPGRRLRNIRVQSKYRKVRLAAARHVAGREGGAKGDVDRCVNQNKARRAPETGWGGGARVCKPDSSRRAPCSIAQCPRLLPAPPAGSPARRGGAAGQRAEGGQRGTRHVLFWAWDLRRSAPGRSPGLWAGPPGWHLHGPLPAKTPRAARIPTSMPRAQAWLGTLSRPGRLGQRTDWRVT